ncbi:MAG: transporter substrate-binding domain-containing protein [Pseudomonadota bacterium]
MLLFAVFGAGADAAPGSDQNPQLRLFTELFPPYSMTIDGSARAASADQVTGFAAETIKELLRRAGVTATLELVPWKRAYARALENPNHGVFATTRTPEREPLFLWVGPLVENDWVFMARADRTIELETLADAGQFRIGGYLEDSIAAYLEEQGLQVDYVASDVLNVRKLARGRIDLWPVVQVDGPPALAVQEGVRVKPVFTIQRTQMALALNPSTDPALVARLQQTLDAMHEDGTVARLKDQFAGP